ncbi:MAG: hypothetical protein ACLSGS_06990 [Adlercreutzia sp.]
MNESWHAAYAADPAEFSALQDTFAYDNYYVPAETYLASRGIDISNRADSVKGLCWGLANLFGTSGWHKFVGGWSDGYVNGTYYNSYNYPGAGLTNDMTDEQFVTTLCDYVIAHVAEFYTASRSTTKAGRTGTNRKGAVPEPASREAHRASCRGRAPCGGFPCGSAGREHPSEEGSGVRLPGGTKPPESVLPPEVNPPAAPEGNPPSAPNEPAPPANDGAGQADPDETPKPDGDSAAPTPPASPSNPETRRLPLDRNDAARGNKASGEHDAAQARKRRRDQVCKSRRKKWRTAASPPLKSQPPLRRRPVNLPKADGDEKNGSETAAKTSKLSQTGDGTTNAPLGVALGQPASPRSQAPRSPHDASSNSSPRSCYSRAPRPKRRGARLTMRRQAEYPSSPLANCLDEEVPTTSPSEKPARNQHRATAPSRRLNGRATIHRPCAILLLRQR